MRKTHRLLTVPVLFGALVGGAGPAVGAGPDPALPSKVSLVVQASSLLAAATLHNGERTPLPRSGVPGAVLRLRTDKGTQRAVIELRRRGRTLRSHAVTGFLVTGGSWVLPASAVTPGATGSIVVTVSPKGEHAFQNGKITGRTYADMQIWRTTSSVRKSILTPASPSFSLDGTAFSLTRVYRDRTSNHVQALVKMTGRHFGEIEAEVPLGAPFPLVSSDTKQLFVLTARRRLAG